MHLWSENEFHCDVMLFLLANIHFPVTFGDCPDISFVTSQLKTVINSLLHNVLLLSRWETWL